MAVWEEASDREYVPTFPRRQLSTNCPPAPKRALNAAVAPERRSAGQVGS